MNERHRKIAYRSERERYDTSNNAWRLLARFWVGYVLPYRWLVALSVVLISLNTSSVYLMAWYGRVIIDDVLVISPAAESAAAPAERGRTSSMVHDAGAGTPSAGVVSEEGVWDVTQGNAPGAAKKLAGMFVLYTVTILALNIAARMAEKSRIAVARMMTARLREDMHEKILKLSRSYHQRHTPGQLMSRVMSDVNVIQNQMATVALNAASHVLTFLIGVAVLGFVEWRALALCLLAVPPYVLVYRAVMAKLREVNRELRHTNACLYSFCTQKFDAFRAIMGYGTEKHERLNFFRLCACFVRDALAQQKMSAFVNGFAAVVTGTITYAIFLAGTRSVIDGSMSVGRMVYVYGTSASIFVPVLGLTVLSVGLNNLVVVLQRIMHVLDEEEEICDAPDAEGFPSPLRDGVSVSNVEFRYVPDSEPVLKNINMEIPAGKWICIMGPSGSGKTAVLSVLARLYDPEMGGVSFDGMPLDRISLESLRKRVAFVPQEPEMLSASIRDNIIYGRQGVEPEQIMAAARAAEIHDTIMEMPVKYETLIGEKGTRLSGGQRQRLSLARALITEPEVLLLDDCTSALDADTEQKIQQTFARLLIGKTAVVVSQRVSMAMRCHGIYVLENGIVSEYGTHSELLAKGGFYARLHEQQT